MSSIITYDQHKTTTTTSVTTRHKTRKPYTSPDWWHGSWLCLMTSNGWYKLAWRGSIHCIPVFRGLTQTPALRHQRGTCAAATMRTLLFASALFAGLFVSLAAVLSPTPIIYRAFCRTMWWVIEPVCCPRFVLGFFLIYKPAILRFCFQALCHTLWWHRGQINRPDSKLQPKVWLWQLPVYGKSSPS